jgi:hypothetical protein
MMDNPSPHTLMFPLFTSQLRTRVSVKRVFTPYDLRLVKQGELTDIEQNRVAAVVRKANADDGVSRGDSSWRKRIPLT